MGNAQSSSGIGYHFSKKLCYTGGGVQLAGQTGKIDCSRVDQAKWLEN